MEIGKETIIIVAGGTGTRMGKNIPKQFLDLQGKPILMHTIEVFHRFDRQMQIIVVLPHDQHKTWEALCKKHHFSINHQLTSGGETRFHSVKNGLALAPETGLIGIHDGVRPLVSAETIERCYTGAEQHGACIPVIPVTESVRLVEGDQSVPVDRSKYVLIQTPQVFKAEWIHQAYNQPFSGAFTDDATVLEKWGQKVVLTEGNFENIKITRPIDLTLAEALLKR
jgi:2-C-methyl-D-erythritol 4-phosphate cytidylyltransferase